MTNVISLKKPAVTIGVGGSHFRFPAIYRTEGFYWQDEDDSSNLSIGTEPASPEYSLVDTPAGFVNPKVTQLKHLENGIDDGWLIVRKHMSQPLASSYIDCLLDNDWLLNSFTQRTGRCLYIAPFGIFTLQHIPRPTERHEDHLMIFVGKGLNWFEEKYWIVRSDGSVSEDIDSVHAD